MIYGICNCGCLSLALYCICTVICTEYYVVQRKSLGFFFLLIYKCICYSVGKCIIKLDVLVGPRLAEMIARRQSTDDTVIDFEI